MFYRFEIISTKGPGVISGVQKKERGSIEYDTKLPETTWISQGLKDLITPALQELMETNPVKDDQMITFDVFFKRVKDVFLRKVRNDFLCYSRGLISIKGCGDVKSWSWEYPEKLIKSLLRSR